MKTKLPLTEFFQTPRYRRSNRSGAAIRALLATLVTFGSSCAVAVPQLHADEFSVVPSGDALYSNLSAVARAGWTSPGIDTGNAVATTTANTTLTRYEMALETAKALVAVKARQQANPQWANSASKPALKALLHMTRTLRPELKVLGVDVTAALNMCTQLIEARPGMAVATPSHDALVLAQSLKAGALVPPHEPAYRATCGCRLQAVVRATEIGLLNCACQSACESARL
jgi:hypothetical protein